MTPFAGAAGSCVLGREVAQAGAKGQFVGGGSGCATALANPDGAGESNRNRVRFALRLLENPCLASLQREVRGRSAENACSHLKKWEVI